MGLDSVELLVAVEDYFSIQIPDAEAEGILTVQNMVDVVAKHLHVVDDSNELEDRIFQKIMGGIRQFSLADNEIKQADRISAYISPDDPEKWSAFRESLQLQVPVPRIKNSGSNGFAGILRNIFDRIPDYDWEAITVEQFIAVVCAANFQELIDRTEIKGKYEVLIVVMGVTVDKLGVDYYEITPDKSFTNDFGID